MSTWSSIMITKKRLKKGIFRFFFIDWKNKYVALLFSISIERLKFTNLFFTIELLDNGQMYIYLCCFDLQVSNLAFKIKFFILRSKLNLIL